MQIIPLQAVPSQAVTVNLGGQNCQVNVYQKSTGLFCDLYVNNVLIIGGVICQNLNRIVRSAYLGFTGDLFFADQHGTDDPEYTGIGSRFLLYYLEAGDVA
jgi:hypothetical protein